MKATFLCIVYAALLPAVACAQAMIEHAAAVAGATAGSVGGKVLSNAIDKTLGKAADFGSAPAAKPAKKSEPTATGAAPGSPLQAAPSSDLPARKSVTRTARAAKAPVRAAEKLTSADEERSIPVAEVVPETAPVAALPPAPHAPTPEEFAKMKEGLTRGEVFAALGTPSSHITIPDDGHLIEILNYSDGAQPLGVIRLDNGQVIFVTPVSSK